MTLGCVRDDGGSDYKHGKRQLLLLEFNSECKHFFALSAPSGYNLHIDDEIKDIADYRPVQAAGSVYIHSTYAQALVSCGLDTYVASGVTSKLHCQSLAADPELAREDAGRFNIQ